MTNQNLVERIRNFSHFYINPKSDGYLFISYLNQVEALFREPQINGGVLTCPDTGGFDACLRDRIPRQTDLGGDESVKNLDVGGSWEGGGGNGTIGSSVWAEKD